MKVETLKVDIYNILDHVAIFRQEDREGGRRTGGIWGSDDAVTAHRNGHPFVDIVLECCLGRDGVTSRYEAMGTNGDIFPVERLWTELEVGHDVGGNAKTLGKRLQHVSIKIS